MNEYQEHVYAIARQVWDSTEDADAFMAAPHALLGGKTPLEVAATEAGAQQVEEILRKIYWGLPG
jgi:putative toxin-antitoxin system antitoxin component (TIGR02293 family)